MLPRVTAAVVDAVEEAVVDTSGKTGEICFRPSGLPQDEKELGRFRRPAPSRVHPRARASRHNLSPANEKERALSRPAPSRVRLELFTVIH